MGYVSVCGCVGRDDARQRNLLLETFGPGVLGVLHISNCLRDAFFSFHRHRLKRVLYLRQVSW